MSKGGDLSGLLWSLIGPYYQWGPIRLPVCMPQLFICHPSFVCTIIFVCWRSLRLNQHEKQVAHKTDWQIHISTSRHIFFFFSKVQQFEKCRHSNKLAGGRWVGGGGKCTFEINMRLPIPSYASPFLLQFMYVSLIVHMCAYTIYIAPSPFERFSYFPQSISSPRHGINRWS